MGMNPAGLCVAIAEEMMASGTYEEDE